MIMSEDGEDRYRPVTDSSMKKEDRLSELDRGVEVESRKSKSSTAKSSVGKLRIKIVLPDRMTSEKHRVEEEHVCTLCRKGFRSKKALGGHMRVHAQRSTDHELKTTCRVDRAADSSETDDDDIEKDEAAEERSSDELNIVVRDRKPICPICKKDFPSKKALFGHMRCHPERKWRGIQPPVYSSSSTVSDVQARSCGGVIQEEEEDGHDQHHEATMESKKRVIDLEKELLKSGWGAKAMRGRDATTVNSSCAADHQFGNMVESNNIAPDQAAGVQSLILLSRGCVDHKNNSTTVRDSINFSKKLKFCGSEELAESRGRKRKISEVLTAEEVSGLTNSANKKFKFANEEDVNDHNKQGAAAGIEHMIESDPLQLTVRPPDGYNANSAELMQIDSTTKKMHKVRKYLMVSDLKAMSTYNLPLKPADHHQVNMEVVSDKERYKCTTCNKSFSSHQALGGHKSSHNKLIRNAQGAGYRIINSNSDAAAAATTLNLAAATHPVHPLHQCNVCFKNYPTGQALGGHKRMHCSLVISKAPPSPVTVVPPPPSPPSVLQPEPNAAPTPPPLSTPAAPKAQASGNVHERCLLDLNEMPPAEDDDDDQVAAVSQAVDLSAAESKQDSGDDVHLPPSDPPSSV